MRKPRLPSIVRILASVTILCMGQAAAQNAQWDGASISRPAFERIPYQETADVISILPSMWVKGLGVQGQWNPLRFRGSGFSQTVFLLNGINFNDPWTGLPDWNFLPEAWLDSIRCLPAMNPYGPAAIGAVVDAASGREPGRRPLTGIAYSNTGDRFSRTSAFFSKAVSSRMIIRAGAAFRNTGESAAPPASDDVTIHGRALFRISGNWRAEYFFGRSGTESDLAFPSVIPGDTVAVEDALYKRNQTHHILSVTSGTLNTKASLRRGTYAYGLNSGPGFTVPRTTVQLEQSSGGSLPLSWGFQSEWDALKTDGYDSGSRWTGSAYAGTRAFILHNLAGRAQARVHRSGDGSLNFLAALGTDWAAENGFTFWFSARQGIRDPSLGEWTSRTFMPFPAVTPEEALPAGRGDAPALNRSLRPERSVNVEAGFETGRNAWMKARFCAFVRQAEGSIERSASGAFVNGGIRRFRGAETSFEAGPWRGFSGRASINYLNSENGDGRLLFDRPNFYGSGHVSWRGSLFMGDLAPTVTLRLRSWSEFWNSWAGSYASTSVLLPLASLLDVRISATVMKKAAVYWMMENVIGSSGWSVAGHPLPVRLTSFGVTWELLD